MGRTGRRYHKDGVGGVADTHWCVGQGWGWGVADTHWCVGLAGGVACGGRVTKLRRGEDMIKLHNANI